MKINQQIGLACALIGGAATVATAAPYASVDAEGAAINSDWSLSDNGATYAAVRKGTPDKPWISPSQAYKGSHSVGFRVYPSTSSETTDKITYEFVRGSKSFAPAADGGKGYTSFALKIPRSDFQAPVGKLLLVQWWQGSPYSPPLRLSITSAGSSNVTYRFLALNDATGGTPSAPVIDIGGGTMPYDLWQTFTVYARFGYSSDGEVRVWQNGGDKFRWTGRVGFDPNTVPYSNPPQGIAKPNANLQIEFGIYRERQNTKQMFFFDEIRYASTFADADPQQGVANTAPSAGDF